MLLKIKSQAIPELQQVRTSAVATAVARVWIARAYATLCIQDWMCAAYGNSPRLTAPACVCCCCVQPAAPRRSPEADVQTAVKATGTTPAAAPAQRLQRNDEQHAAAAGEDGGTCILEEAPCACAGPYAAVTSGLQIAAPAPAAPAQRAKRPALQPPTQSLLKAAKTKTKAAAKVASGQRLMNSFLK